MCAKMKVSRNIGKHAACFLAAAGVFLGGADLTAAEAETPAAAVLSVTDAAAVSVQSASKAELADDVRAQTEEDASPDYGVALGAPYDDAGFWCDAAGDRLLGTAEDVARLNEELHANQPSLVSLAELPRAVSSRQLRRWMEEAAPEREGWYAPTEPLSAEAYQATVENCAADKLPLRNPLRYGVTVRRADLRGLPTEEAWLDAPDDVHYDILQATAVDPAEPLAVWHESADGKFLFVSMRYYRGWLARDAVAFTQRETWLAYVQPEDFLVVTQNRYETPEEAGGQVYQLGSRIPLVQQGGAHLARLPQRAADSSLQEMLVPLPYSERASLAVEDAGDMEAAALHRGSLPYTANNLRRRLSRVSATSMAGAGRMRASTAPRSSPTSTARSASSCRATLMSRRRRFCGRVPMWAMHRMRRTVRGERLRHSGGVGAARKMPRRTSFSRRSTILRPRSEPKRFSPHRPRAFSFAPAM